MATHFELFPTSASQHGPAGLEQSVSLETLPDADAPLDALLAPFKRSSLDLLASINAALEVRGFWPWAIVLFEREFRLAGHVRTTRQAEGDVMFSGYSIRPGYSPRRHGAPPVSILLFRDKPTAAGHADASPLFRVCWDALVDLPAERHWLCVADSPPEDWVRETESGDDVLFDRAN